MLMWVMSDRAIPRSYRMMQGFGVHTFRFLNAAGESRFVKFHWTPLAGTHSLAWDEAVKIAGADPDFHRRDLWEAIEAGAYPEYELGVQVFTRRAGRGVQLRRARRDEDRARGTRADPPVGRHGAEPQPGQFLRRDGAGGVLRGAYRAGHRLQQRPAAGRPHPLVRRHAVHAARRPQLPRDPDQRPGRGGAQQPARRLAPPHAASWARRVRAEFARRRLPFPGGHGDGLHVVPRADRGGQGARQAAEVRRALHAGRAVLEQPESAPRRRTSCVPSASS